MNIRSDTYHTMLKSSNLRIVYKEDTTGYTDGDGYYLYSFMIAPIFNEDGKKVSWGLSHDDYGFLSEHKTKKEALSQLPENRTEPWYAGLPGYDTPQGVYISDGVYGHKDGRLTDTRPNR